MRKAMEFAVLNEDVRRKLEKKLEIEKDKIYKMYMNYLINGNIESLLQYTLLNEENKVFYKKIRQYTLINFIIKNNFEQVEKTLNLKEIEADPKVFLYLLEMACNQKQLLRTRKMLRLAEKKEYFFKKYYDVKKRYKKIMKEKIKN